MHPQDALLSGVRIGELVRVTTRWGSLVARLRASGEMPRRMIFVPMHWSNAFSADARVGALVNPVVDPVSGEPESKHTPARVTAFVVAWQGFVLSRRRLVLKDATSWSVAQGDGFLRYELAGRRVHGDWLPWARRLLHASDTDRAGLLMGQPVDATADIGAVVCSCFGVGRNTILSSIRRFGSRTPEQIGQRLRAGTNCGSCRPELKAILNEHGAMLS